MFLVKWKVSRYIMRGRLACLVSTKEYTNWFDKREQAEKFVEKKGSQKTSKLTMISGIRIEETN